MKVLPRRGQPLCLECVKGSHHLPNSFWIFFCTLGLVTRYMRLQEMAVVTVSNPDQGKTKGKEIKCLADQGSWAKERHNGVAHTSSEEVQDNINDLLIRHLDIGILIQLLVLTVLNQAVCDIPNVTLGGESPQMNKIPNPDLCLHSGLVPHHP